MQWNTALVVTKVRHADRLPITSATEVMFSSLFVCLLATLRKKVQIFREGRQWANEQMIEF